MGSSLNGTGVTFSNGSTQAVAWPGNTGTVTSVATGNGLTGGTITSSGTISLDYYTGTTANNTSYPVGTYLGVSNNTCSQIIVNQNTAVGYVTSNGNAYSFANAGYTGLLAGTWRWRGQNLAQRVA